MIRRLVARRRFKREHRWTHAHLSEFVDRELDAAEATRVQEHVEICPQCRRVLATLRRTLEGLRSLSTKPRSGVSESVIERLRGEP